MKCEFAFPSVIVFLLFSGGANLTCTVLWNHLNKNIGDDTPRAQHLYVQADNC